MICLGSLKPRLLAGAGLAATGAAIYALSLTCLAGPENKPEKAAEKKSGGLSGSDLYAMHCSRCHSERYATEYTPAQWKTILTHMRVRANLPASQAELILKYLQENAGN